MIEREKVIKSLEECSGGDCSGCQYFGQDIYVDHCWDKLMKVAAELLKEQEPQWISVDDRMPEGMGTVLIAHKGGVSFGWFNGAYWTKGAATKHKPIKTVTHWMPLPEPPKEDEE